MDGTLTIFPVARKGTPAPLSPSLKLALLFWQSRAAEYVREKRGAKLQKQVGVVRQTLSAMENSKSNFTLKKLLQALEAINGDISDLFKSPLPPEMRGKHRIHLEMLYEVMTSEDRDEADFLSHAVMNSWQKLDARRRNRVS